jgi:hypothetical protein
MTRRQRRTRRHLLAVTGDPQGLALTVREFLEYLLTRNYSERTVGNREHGPARPSELDSGLRPLAHPLEPDPLQPGLGAGVSCRCPGSPQMNTMPPRPARIPASALCRAASSPARPASGAADARSAPLASPTASTVPGSAADWSRAATFMASPVAP